MLHTDLGEEVMNRFAEKTKEFAVIEQKAKLDGRNMTMLLAPIKEKK